VIDQAGIYYRIPIACINDPFTYNKNNQLDELKTKKIPNEKTLKVRFFSLYLLARLKFDRLPATK